MRSHASSAMTQCIEHCLQCYRTCFETAMTVCLEHGGRHVAKCAEHCRKMAE